MPVYTFFPYLSGGSSLTFEAVELSDDDAAIRKGLQILAEHGSAAEVEIWRDDRLIHRERRVVADTLAAVAGAGLDGDLQQPVETHLA